MPDPFRQSSGKCVSPHLRHHRAYQWLPSSPKKSPSMAGTFHSSATPDQPEACTAQAGALRRRQDHAFVKVQVRPAWRTGPEARQTVARQRNPVRWFEGRFRNLHDGLGERLVALKHQSCDKRRSLRPRASGDGVTTRGLVIHSASPFGASALASWPNRPALPSSLIFTGPSVLLPCRNLVNCRTLSDGQDPSAFPVLGASTST